MKLQPLTRKTAPSSDQYRCSKCGQSKGFTAFKLLPNGKRTKTCTACQKRQVVYDAQRGNPPPRSDGPRWVDVKKAHGITPKEMRVMEEAEAAWGPGHKPCASDIIEARITSPARRIIVARAMFEYMRERRMK